MDETISSLSHIEEDFSNDFEELSGVAAKNHSGQHEWNDHSELLVEEEIITHLDDIGIDLVDSESTARSSDTQDNHEEESDASSDGSDDEIRITVQDLLREHGITREELLRKESAVDDACTTVDDDFGANETDTNDTLEMNSIKESGSDILQDIVTISTDHETHVLEEASNKTAQPVAVAVSNEYGKESQSLMSTHRFCPIRLSTSELNDSKPPILVEHQTMKAFGKPRTTELCIAEPRKPETISNNQFMAEIQERQYVHSGHWYQGKRAHVSALREASSRIDSIPSSRDDAIMHMVLSLCVQDSLFPQTNRRYSNRHQFNTRPLRIPQMRDKVRQYQTKESETHSMHSKTVDFRQSSIFDRSNEFLDRGALFSVLNPRLRNFLHQGGGITGRMNRIRLNMMIEFAKIISELALYGHFDHSVVCVQVIEENCDRNALEMASMLLTIMPMTPIGGNIFKMEYWVQDYHAHEMTMALCNNLLTDKSDNAMEAVKYFEIVSKVSTEMLSQEKKLRRTDRRELPSISFNNIVANCWSEILSQETLRVRPSEVDPVLCEVLDEVLCDPVVVQSITEQVLHRIALKRRRGEPQ